MACDLRSNPHLLKAHGVIGRRDYFINNLKLTCITLLAFSPYIYFELIGERYGHGLTFETIAPFVCILPITYFAFQNSFKRLRDIRGTTENQFMANSIMVVTMAIPVVGFFINLALFSMKGKITNNPPHRGTGKPKQLQSKIQPELQKNKAS